MESEFFIALRYLFAKKTHNVINVISAISWVGMAVGTAALILILSVFNGFNEIIKTNLSDLDPDIKISRSDSRLFDASAELFDFLYEEFEVVSQSIEENVFVTYDGRQAVAKARGVDSVFETNSKIGNHISAGSFSLHFGELPQAIVGAELAYSLGVNPRFSDKLCFYYPSLDSGLVPLNSVSLVPSGLLSISSVVDKELVILPIEMMRGLICAENGVSSLDIYCAGGVSKVTLGRIAERLGPEFRVRSREMLNASLYKMMRYEKLALYAILLFVVIIIAFNIFSSLSMLVIAKSADSFQLRAMGFGAERLRRLFVLEGVLTSLLGSVVGLVLGLGLAFLQIRFGVFKMPSGFFVNAYPCLVQAADVLLTFLGVGLIGVVVSTLSVRKKSFI